MATCPKCGTRYASNVKICTHDGTVLDDERAADPHIGKLLDGKYRLDAFLSQGGMGAVYKATHVMLDKTVVVKLIKPELVTSAEIVRRFQREARAASNLNHPNIVQVFDLGQTDDGTLYIAMEFIDGPSLKDVIRKTGPMAVPRIKSILRQVANALAEAHSHSIIHRDLKPHNVMLAKGPAGQEVAKLLDFGIAKTFEEGTQLTQTGFAIGTPQYMAPEQAAGKEVTAQSDLYSLGTMLYEMLIGEVPFDAPTTAAILIKQLTEAPQRPSLRKPQLQVSPVLESIALRCLDKEPANRFPSAEAFAEALTHADGGTAAAPAPAASAPTRILASPLAEEAGPTVLTTPPSRTATTAAPPIASAPPAPTHPAPVPTLMAPPPAAPVAAAPIAAPPIVAPPPVLAAPPPAAAPPSEGTRPTVPGSAMPVATAPPPPASSSRTGLWITLGAVAVLVAAVAALQLGLLPGQNANSSGPQQAQSTPAPQASPASADAPPAATSPATAAAPAAPASPFRAEAAPPSAPAQASAPAPAATTQPSAARPQASATVASAASGSTRPAPAGAPAPARTPAPTPAVTPAAASPARAPQPAPAPSVAAPAAAPAPAARSENPTVFLRCEGVPAVCNALRASLLEQFQKHNIQPVREPNRAAIVLTGNVEVVQERVSREFGQPMQTRTYTVDVSGETRDGNPVSMPPPRTFSFDAQFGRERLDENARVIASDVTDKIRAFWNK